MLKIRKEEAPKNEPTRKVDISVAQRLIKHALGSNNGQTNDNTSMVEETLPSKRKIEQLE